MLFFSYDHLPALKLGSTIDVQNEWPSVMATADDLNGLKATARRLLPDLKPTERLEYLARAFGYRSAASLQSALKSATRAEPAILTPSEGYPDPYRLKHLLAREERHLASTCTEGNLDDIDTFQISMRDIAGIACRDIRRKRNPDYKDNHWMVNPEHAGLVVGLDRGVLVENADLSIPSLAGRIQRAAVLDFNECIWDQGLQDGETVQLLDLQYEAMVSDDERESQSEGDHPAIRHRRPSWVLNQEASRHHHRATLLHRQISGRLAGSLTFGISCRPISIESALIMARSDIRVQDCEPDEQDSLIQYIAEEARCCLWECCLSIEQSTTHDGLSGAEIERNRVVLQSAVAGIFEDYLIQLAQEVAGSDSREASITVDLSFNPESVWGDWEAELSEWVDVMTNGTQEMAEDFVMGYGQVEFFLSDLVADYLEDELDIETRRP